MPGVEDSDSGSGSASLLDRLPPEFAAKLVGERTVTLRQGETLFERGDAGDGCYLLRQGVVAITATSAMGDQRTLAILGPPALIGELAMIDGLPRSAGVAALRDCSLAFISRAAFMAVVRQHPELHMEITATLAARLRQSDEEVIAASFLSIRARVARALLQFARHFGEPTDSARVRIRQPVSQNDLAAMAGVARESVSRTLGVWHKAKILEESPRRNYLVDIGRLEREAAVME